MIFQIMAFSRLFGKTKREVVSPTEDRDDEAGVVPPPDPKPVQDPLPYQLPYQAQQKAVLSRQRSQAHPLQGVHFSLSPR